MGVEGKILLEVFLPSAKNSFDVFVYPYAPVHEIILLVSSTFSELSNGFFKGNNETLLYFKDSGKQLDINLSSYENGLKNGSQLIMI